MCVYVDKSVGIHCITSIVILCSLHLFHYKIKKLITSWKRSAVL